MKDNVLSEEYREQIQSLTRDQIEQVVLDAVDMTWHLAMRIILLGRIFEIPDDTLQELLMMNDEMFDIASQEYDIYGAPGIEVVRVRVPRKDKANDNSNISD